LCREFRPWLTVRIWVLPEKVLGVKMKESEYIFIYIYRVRKPQISRCGAVQVESGLIVEGVLEWTSFWISPKTNGKSSIVFRKE
jgi:hypothetical protein